jgi:hypothetical protein
MILVRLPPVEDWSAIACERRKMPKWELGLRPAKQRTRNSGPVKAQEILTIGLAQGAASKFRQNRNSPCYPLRTGRLGLRRSPI